MFGYGGALTKLTNVEEARRVFSRIVELYPTNQQTALAWGEIGNCSLQLAVENVSYYAEASNAYQRAITSPLASVTARSQAKVGLGTTLEKVAELTTGDEKSRLLMLARDNYLDVTLETSAAADLFWQKEAGRKAVRVLEALEDWCAVEKLCGQLQAWLPWARASLEASRERASKLCREKTKAAI